MNKAVQESWLGNDALQGWCRRIFLSTLPFLIRALEAGWNGTYIDFHDLLRNRFALISVCCIYVSLSFHLQTFGCDKWKVPKRFLCFFISIFLIVVFVKVSKYESEINKARVELTEKATGETMGYKKEVAELRSRLDYFLSNQNVSTSELISLEYENPLVIRSGVPVIFSHPAAISAELIKLIAQGRPTPPEIVLLDESYGEISDDMGFVNARSLLHFGIKAIWKNRTLRLELDSETTKAEASSPSPTTPTPSTVTENPRPTPTPVTLTSTDEKALERYAWHAPMYLLLFYFVAFISGFIISKQWYDRSCK